MNKFIQVCLGALGVMASAGWAGDAQAEPGFRFKPIRGLHALATAVDEETVYALDGGDFTSASGYRIRTHNVSGNGAWLPKAPSDGRGTSLAVDAANSIVYTVSRDNHVWSKITGATGWNKFPRTKCAGGDLTPRQVVGQNNVSSYNHNTYVIAGTRVYYWQNGSCWYELPALPGGSPVEIAQAGQDPTQIWALNASMEIYHWNGTWQRMAPGLGLGLGFRKVIGSDGATLWDWDPATGSFTHDDEWTFGAISQMQRSKDTRSFDGYGVVQPDGKLWWFGYHHQ